jgi:hypothetical protein
VWANQLPPCTAGDRILFVGGCASIAGIGPVGMLRASGRFTSPRCRHGLQTWPPVSREAPGESEIGGLSCAGRPRPPPCLASAACQGPMKKPPLVEISGGSLRIVSGCLFGATASAAWHAPSAAGSSGFSFVVCRLVSCCLRVVLSQRSHIPTDDGRSVNVRPVWRSAPALH